MGNLSQPTESGEGTGADLPPPPFVTAGRYVLQRTAAEFPDELIYVGAVGHGYDAWLKSLNMLAGPWEWVIQQGGESIDFSARRFSTRTDAAADLLAALDGLIGAPPLESSGAAGPVLASRTAAPVVSASGADADVLAMALDLAILTLQKARSTMAAAAGR